MNLVPGDWVGVRGPYGNGFPIRKMEEHDLLLVAGGIGLAPLRSLIIYVLEKRDSRWVHVLMHGSYPVDKIPENYVRKFYSNMFEKKE